MHKFIFSDYEFLLNLYHMWYNSLVALYKAKVKLQAS